MGIEMTAKGFIHQYIMRHKNVCSQTKLFAWGAISLGALRGVSNPAFHDA
jgi:hypothetical protein